MKFNPESQLNIHELAVEEPEKEKLNILFDFKRDVLPHKEQILSLIEDCRGSSWIDFTFLASRAKIIGIDVNLKNEDAERLQAERNSYKNSLYSAQLYFTQIAAREAILGTDPKLSNEEKGEIKAQAERFRNSRTEVDHNPTTHSLHLSCEEPSKEANTATSPIGRLFE